MKLGVLLLGTALACGATDLQGVLADWSCVPRMVQDGAAKTLKNDKSCVLTPNYSRAAYGLITQDKKYYKLDDAGRAWALRLLKDSHEKDNLKVIVTGTVEGDTIHVASMSEL